MTDYGDAVLIDKGLVHALNHDIKKLAREKIQARKPRPASAWVARGVGSPPCIRIGSSWHRLPSLHRHG